METVLKPVQDGRGRKRRWLAEQKLAVLQECLVDLREPLEYGMVCRDVLAQTDEGSDHVNAHLHRAPAAQHVRRHQCAVLCERPRAKSRVPVLLGTGHNL